MKSDLFISPWLVNTLLNDFDSQEGSTSSSHFIANKCSDSIAFPNEVPDNTNLSIPTPISSANLQTFRYLFSILKRGKSLGNLQIIQFLRLPANPKDTPSDWIFLVTDHEYCISANFSLDALDALSKSHPDIPFSRYEGLFLSIESCQFTLQSDGYFHLHLLQCAIVKKKHGSSIRTIFPNMLKNKQVRKLRWDLFRLLRKKNCSSVRNQIQETHLSPIIGELQPSSTAILSDSGRDTAPLISDSPQDILIQSHLQCGIIPSISSVDKLFETVHSPKPINAHLDSIHHLELPLEALQDIQIAIDFDMQEELEKHLIELQSLSSTPFRSNSLTNPDLSVQETGAFISISNTSLSISNESIPETNTSESPTVFQSNHSLPLVSSFPTIPLSIFDVSNPISSGNTTDLSSNLTSISETDSSFPCTWPLPEEEDEEGPVHKKFIILD